MKETSSARPLLSARDLCIDFNVRGRTLRAVRSVSLDLYAGETLAVVGESGSGKSVLTKSLVGMLDRNGRVASGEIWFGDRELTRLSGEKEWCQIRGKKIAMIFQDPMTALNPLKTIGAQVAEVIRLHRGADKKSARALALDMLDRVGIPDPARRYKQYPHEFSGGMRQRVVIAVAVACEPEVLLCDEPTTALDVTIQAQILTLLKGLQKEMDMSMIFITHDLGVVARVADRVAVMYGGRSWSRAGPGKSSTTPGIPIPGRFSPACPSWERKGRSSFPSRERPPTCT